MLLTSSCANILIIYLLTMVSVKSGRRLSGVGGEAMLLRFF